MSAAHNAPMMPRPTDDFSSRHPNQQTTATDPLEHRHPMETNAPPSSYETTGSTTRSSAPATGAYHTTSTTAGGTTGDKVEGGMGKLKGIAAKVHGIGETIRGNSMAAADELSGDRGAADRNMRLGEKGQRQMISGRFE